MLMRCLGLLMFGMDRIGHAVANLLDVFLHPEYDELVTYTVSIWI